MATKTTIQNRTPAEIDVDGRHDEPKRTHAQDSHAPTHDGPAMDLKPIGTGKVILFAIVFVILFVILFFLGYWPAIHNRHLADAAAQQATDNRPMVDVARPHAPTHLPALQLP